MNHNFKPSNLLVSMYTEAYTKKGDIDKHVPVIKEYASKCDHITEFGVRGVVSLWGWLMGGPKKLVGYDLYKDPNVLMLEIAAEESGVEFEFHTVDVRKVEIEETDMLFIDTHHTYNQLKQELKMHAHKAKKFIAFHDTTLFEYIGEDGGAGLWPAIQEFLEDHPEWKIKERLTDQNGFTVLERA